MIKRYSVIFLLSLIFHVSFGNSSIYFNSNCKEIYNNTINLNFELAQQLIERERALSNNSNFALDYLECFNLYIKILVSEDKSTYSLFLQKRDAFLDNIEENLIETDPYYNYYITDVYIQSSFLRFRFNEKIKAAYDVIKANKYLTYNLSNHPNFIYNYKCKGIISFMTGLIPDEYKWVTNIISVNPDIDKGISYLYKFYEQTNNQDFTYLKTEALFLLSNMLAKTNKDFDPNIFKYFKLSIEKGETNPLLFYSYISYLKKYRKNEDILYLSNNLFFDKFAKKFPYLFYYIGVANMNQLDAKKSIFFFEKYLTYKLNNNYTKSTYQKIAWVYLLNNDTANYINSLNKIKRFNYISILEEDKNAEIYLYELSSKKYPNINLLKSRVLFDGGYYTQSLKNIATRQVFESLKNNDEKIEYYYRQAQNYRYLDKTDLAIEYFNLATSNSNNSSNFVVANSYLSMGEIYYKQKLFNQAESNLKKCLKENPNQYKYSIHQKAKYYLKHLTD
ncbi:MAG: hypothetical protein A2X12_08745 [Bacteroidetes bacterium GWE2_29_8]|nr:MAG: hypothetical protein A2X12_08745 [Bacteroidetes bacterium GWE2_29_8]OFY18357.1 MAG: hypothetical protein A2X02_08445 [Bacteroidetes bacterium GWF2_29_10]